MPNNEHSSVASQESAVSASDQQSRVSSFIDEAPSASAKPAEARKRARFGVDSTVEAHVSRDSTRRGSAASASSDTAARSVGGNFSRNLHGKTADATPLQQPRRDSNRLPKRFFDESTTLGSGVISGDKSSESDLSLRTRPTGHVESHRYSDRPPKLTDGWPASSSSRARQGKSPDSSPLEYARATEQVAPRRVPPHSNRRVERQQKDSGQPQRDAEGAVDPAAARKLLRNLIDQLDNQVDALVSASSPANFSSEEPSSALQRISPPTVSGVQSALGEAPGTVEAKEVTAAVNVTETESFGVRGTAAATIPPNPPPKLGHVAPAWTGGPAKETHRRGRPLFSTQSSDVSEGLFSEHGFSDAPSLTGKSLAYEEARKIDHARSKRQGKRVALAVPLSVKAQFDQGKVPDVDLPSGPEPCEIPPHDPGGAQFLSSIDPTPPQPASAPIGPQLVQPSQAGALDRTPSRSLSGSLHLPADLVSPIPPGISGTRQECIIETPGMGTEPQAEARPENHKMSILADYHANQFRTIAHAQKKAKRDRRQRKESSVDLSAPSEELDDDRKSLATARGTLVLGDERRSTLRVPSKEDLLKKRSMIYAWQDKDDLANTDIFIKKCRLWNGSAFHVEMGRLWQSDVVSGGLVSKKLLPNVHTFDIFRNILFVAHDVVVGVFNMHEVLRGVRTPIALIVSNEPITTVHYSERFGALLIWDARKTPFFCDVCKLFPDVFPLCRQRKKKHKTLRGRVYGPQWFRHTREANMPDGLSVMQTNFDNLNFDDSDSGSDKSADSRATAASTASTTYSFLDAPTFYPKEPTCKLIVWGDHKRHPKERLIEYLVGVLREEQLKRRAKLLGDRENVDDDKSEDHGPELRMNLKMLLDVGIPAVHLKQNGQDRVLETVRGMNEVQQEKKKFNISMEAQARAITYLYYRTLQQRNQIKFGSQVASVEKNIFMPRRVAVDTLGFDAWIAGEYEYGSGNHYVRLDQRVKLVWDGVSWRFKDADKKPIVIFDKQVASLPIGRVGPMTAVWPHILLISNLDDRKAMISEMEQQHHKILEMNFRVAWKHYYFAKKMLNGENDADERLWKNARCVKDYRFNPALTMDEPHEIGPLFRRYQDMKCEESLQLVIGRPLFVQDLDDRTIPASVYVEDDIIYLESCQDAKWWEHLAQLQNRTIFMERPPAPTSLPTPPKEESLASSTLREQPTPQPTQTTPPATPQPLTPPTTPSHPPDVESEPSVVSSDPSDSDIDALDRFTGIQRFYPGFMKRKIVAKRTDEYYRKKLGPWKAKQEIKQNPLPPPPDPVTKGGTCMPIKKKQAKVDKEYDDQLIKLMQQQKAEKRARYAKRLLAQPPQRTHADSQLPMGSEMGTESDSDAINMGDHPSTGSSLERGSDSDEDATDSSGPQGPASDDESASS